MKLIAITGMPGSGKGEVQKIIRERTKAPVVMMSHAVEEDMRAKGITDINSNIREYATELRKKHGKGVVAELCFPMIDKLESDVVIIDGIRAPEEVKAFKRKYGDDFILLSVHASPETRFERLKARGKSWDMQSIDEFRDRDNKELSWGLGEAIAIADQSVANEGTVDELRGKVLDFMKNNLNAGGKGKETHEVLKMQVIGLMGSIGAGKGAVSDYLHNDYGFEVITMGDLVREEIVEQGLEVTRDNLDKLSKERTSKFGPEYWMKKAANRIESSESKRVVIDGIRYPLDVEFFKKHFGDKITFVLVDADPKIRFERMMSRGRPGFPDTFEKFQEHERRQDGLFSVSKAFAMADHRMDNSGTFEELYEQVDRFVKLLGLD
jgi:dephospho-CoA kinase